MNNSRTQHSVVYRGKSTTIDVVAGDIMNSKYAKNKFYELDLLEAIRRMALRGTYIDVGANIGNHTLFFAEHCPATNVLAIEPFPSTFQILEDNCTRSTASSRIKLVRSAVGTGTGGVAMTEEHEHNRGSMHVTGPGTIPMTTLDSIAFSQNLISEPVVFIKIDVENYEEEVLRSASRLLASRPAFSIECQSVDRLQAVMRMLGPLGYTHSKAYCATPTYLFSTK